MDHGQQCRNRLHGLCAPFGRGWQRKGIGCFIVPYDADGLEVGEYMWTFNMPTDHPKLTLKDVWIPADSILGDLDYGLACAQGFVHENRIRQAASSLGAAQYCINEAVKYAGERKPFGKPLSTNQAIQFPLVELQTDAEMLRLLIWKTAAEMDSMPKPDVAKYLSDKVSMCNYKANRLVCDAADTAMQVHGGIGLFAAQTVRTYLSPPPPLPDHRRFGRNPDAQSGRAFIRLYGPKQTAALALIDSYHFLPIRLYGWHDANRRQI